MTIAIQIKLTTGLVAIKPDPEISYLYPNGEVLNIEEWAADCADIVVKGLVDLAELAETFAHADWRAEVLDWIDEPLAAP
jgi:hypothetical protein